MDAPKIIELMAELSVPLLALIAALVGWKHNGKLDLDKALLHAADVLHVVRDHIVTDEGDDSDAALERGLDAAVEEVAKVRGKRMSKKVRRKLRMRLRTLVENGG